MMKATALTLGILCLLGTIVPPALVLAGMMDDAPMKLAMLVSTVLWFVTAQLWMARR